MVCINMDMTVSVELGYDMSSCPTWWNNFITALQNNKYHEISIAAVDKGLEPFNGWWSENKKTNREVINFASEQDYLLFVLKYS